MRSPPMMKCGHAANATTVRDGVKIPCCAICAGFRMGAEEVDPTPLNLAGRVATCSGVNPRPSSSELAFFEYRPDLDHDIYYCGCRGWD